MPQILIFSLIGWIAFSGVNQDAGTPINCKSNPDNVKCEYNFNK